jgi:hypothetical protein
MPVHRGGLFQCKRLQQNAAKLIHPTKAHLDGRYVIEKHDGRWQVIRRHDFWVHRAVVVCDRVLVALGRSVPEGCVTCWHNLQVVLVDACNLLYLSTHVHQTTMRVVYSVRQVMSTDSATLTKRRNAS